MPENLTHIDFWMVVITLIGIIWYQQRSARKAGFKAGAAYGLMYGATQAADMLTGGKYSVITENGNQIYLNETLLEEILLLAKERLLKNSKEFAQ